MNSPMVGVQASATPAALALALDTELAALPDLAARLVAARATLSGRLAFSTSLGIEDQAILHAIWQNRASFAADAIDVFTLDTGRLFAETLETLAASEDHYRMPIRALAPDAGMVEALMARDGVLGFRQSIEARKACCDIRKVQPLERALKGAAAWITGLRRGQSGARADVPFANYDAERGLIKINPLADWTTERLAAFVAAERIPINPLHAKGFPSIGCQPCTRAIEPGQDLRAGRWWWEHEDKKECGLHFRRPSQTGVHTVIPSQKLSTQDRSA
jgi:phosphoadenosine phosphosulfate reductase